MTMEPYLPLHSIILILLILIYFFYFFLQKFNRSRMKIFFWSWRGTFYHFISSIESICLSQSIYLLFVLFPFSSFFLFFILLDFLCSFSNRFLFIFLLLQGLEKRIYYTEKSSWAYENRAVRTRVCSSSVHRRAD